VTCGPADLKILDGLEISEEELKGVERAIVSITVRAVKPVTV
jgi:hypothetical protein